MQASPYTEAGQNRWNGDRTPQALFSFGYCLGRQSTMLFPGQGTGSSWWYGATGGFYWWKEVAPYGFGTDQGWINECKMALRSYKEITGVRIHLSRKNGILKSRKSSSRFPEIIIIFSFLFSYHSEAAQLPKMRSLPRTHDPLLIRPCRGFFYGHKMHWSFP